MERPRQTGRTRGDVHLVEGGCLGGRGLGGPPGSTVKVGVPFRLPPDSQRPLSSPPPRDSARPAVVGSSRRPKGPTVDPRDRSSAVQDVPVGVRRPPTTDRRLRCRTTRRQTTPLSPISFHSPPPTTDPHDPSHTPLGHSPTGSSPAVPARYRVSPFRRETSKQGFFVFLLFVVTEDSTGPSVSFGLH